MHKLKLDLDQLSVESFETNATEDARRGTVKAHSHVHTCGASCYDTCATCDPSCASCVTCYD
ncbi:MAG: pinensin family lanthipeptide, partial [Longimicrobiaceae bacterium]